MIYRECFIAFRYIFANVSSWFSNKRVIFVKEVLWNRKINTYGLIGQSSVFTQQSQFWCPRRFLTVLLGEKIQIMEILESEGNQQREDDKFNRVDIRARNSKDEIILVEVQNTRELYYLERILYGVAKAITEHIDLGGIYANVKKVYSISILYLILAKEMITSTMVRIHSSVSILVTV